MSTIAVQQNATGTEGDVAATNMKDGAPQSVPQTGAPNPYALASLVAGRRINWDDVPDGPALLEEIFDQPYSEIIGSADSPIFYGTTFEGGRPVRTRPQVDEVVTGNDSDVATDGPDVSKARTLADLVTALGTEQLTEIPVRGATLTRNGVLAELGRSGSGASRFARLFDERIIDILFPTDPGYHPSGFSWQDTGRFYNETTEFFDPVQGQVGDCYFIAAMSSVAWAMPFTIADRTRATATAQDSFTHQIGFNDGSTWRNVEVSDRVLVASGGSVSYYAHSVEAGEIWPAVYEKAYAKWRFGTNDDFPNIPALAWGDPVAACRDLTGGTPYYNSHSGITDAELLSLVKSHSVGGRTTTPMVAWSHGAGSDEAARAANDAGIVASHAYSVLGWMRRYEWAPRWRLDVEIPRIIPKWKVPGPGPVLAGDGAGAAVDELTRLRLDLPEELFHRFELVPIDYVIARNPWGSAPGTGSSTASGDYRAYDVSWWRDVQLGTNGVFAMEVGAFRRYFAGTGGTV